MRLHRFTPLAATQPVFAFEHPGPAAGGAGAPPDNTREAPLRFERPGAPAAVCHGFAGYFDAQVRRPRRRPGRPPDEPAWTRKPRAGRLSCQARPCVQPLPSLRTLGVAPATRFQGGACVMAVRAAQRMHALCVLACTLSASPAVPESAARPEGPLTSPRGPLDSRGARSCTATCGSARTRPRTRPACSPGSPSSSRCAARCTYPPARRSTRTCGAAPRTPRRARAPWVCLYRPPDHACGAAADGLRRMAAVV